MLFDITTALKVRNHYQSVLIGTSLEGDSRLKIDGIFICHKGTVQDAITIILNNNFDERFPLISTTDDKEKNLEIYVYAYDGANFLYHELDKNITDKGIEKIYPTT
jgi:hypothetical protein